MKKILVLVFCATLLLSCGGKGGKPQAEKSSAAKANVTQSDIHNAKNSLDYMGVYYGKITEAGKEVDVYITLKDSTFTKMVEYNSSSASSIDGTYSWNEEGNTITLNEEEKPNQYFVGENTLTCIDVNGSKVEGCILKKE